MRQGKTEKLSHENGINNNRAEINKLESKLTPEEIKNLDQELANLFSKGAGKKYLRLCGPLE